MNSFAGHPGSNCRKNSKIRLAALRAALAEGEASGPSTPFDFDAFLEGKRNREKSPARQEPRS
ncbi:type II toxin-antitoxin system ParD family antitoxin [Roseospira visakhapatnamensis]|uniref:Arc/MetJ-type ribon-helix-helix transcriptional regulator n=1 Tax=Roseospira visakhapatnamensis TaxID=390880 RepID=A0A7W6RH65_9PROT|nr:type II toxin-antitoxin system ParD family antitoxin [Roseospira visakhapatnamensis]MBB4267916.1 Arc/MetJ-type ribon-helix-helix transcriptional regulator [Roseospira visakhapatnamensis]